MIVGTTARFAEKARTYTTLAGMVSDGFLTTDPEYLTAAAVKAQNPSLTTWKIGKRSTNVPTETVTLTVNSPLVSGQKFDFFVNGFEVIATSTSTSTSAMATLLATAITAVATSVSAVTSAGAVITVTQSGYPAGSRGRIKNWNTPQGGQGLLNYQDGTTAAAADIATDLNAIQAFDGNWYGLLSANQSSQEIQGFSAWAESADPKVFFVYDNSDDLARQAAVTTDVFSVLMATNRLKTMGLWNGNDTQAHSSAAWMGAVFAMGNPGAVNWNFRQLSGPVADNLTATDITNLNAKRANQYVLMAGLSLIQGGGHVASNEFADVVYGLDALTLDMATRIFTDLANNPKIPYTDLGLDIIRGDITASLTKFSGPNYLLLVPGSFTITIPLVANVSSADKGTRTVNNITWIAQLQGAVNFVNVAGNVSL